MRIKRSFWRIIKDRISRPSWIQDRISCIDYRLKDCEGSLRAFSFVDYSLIKSELNSLVNRLVELELRMDRNDERDFETLKDITKAIKQLKDKRRSK
jgi:hypothetical protein